MVRSHSSRISVSQSVRPSQVPSLQNAEGSKIQLSCLIKPPFVRCKNVMKYFMSSHFVCNDTLDRLESKTYITKWKNDHKSDSLILKKLKLHNINVNVSLQRLNRNGKMASFFLFFNYVPKSHISNS